MFPVVVLVAVACAQVATATAETLANGAYAHYSYTQLGDTDYQIRFSQDTTACSTTNAIGSCCVLLVNKGILQPSISLYDLLIASPANANPLDFIRPGSNGSLSVAVYGVDSCRFSPPEVTPVTELGSMARGEGFGQGVKAGDLSSGVSLDISVSAESQPRYVLRDISRRASTQGVGGNANVGAMANGAEISTKRYFGLAPDKVALTELRPVLTPEWNEADNAAQVDAHRHSTLVYDYLLQQLNINSFDNAGSSMVAQVDVPFPTQTEIYCGVSYPPNSMLNAFWDGFSINFTPRQLVNQTYATSYAAALDVTAHEWGHALSERGANLVYEREPGALNEAYSDWLGTAVKFANGGSDWVMGRVTLAARDLANPQNFGDPHTYKGKNWQDTSVVGCPLAQFCNDYCGVHVNSGVPNKMFYLLVAGGTHNDVSVAGIGMETAIKIATDAVRFYWSTQEDFLSARLGMQAAAKSYGAHAEAQVGAAWRAVGVLTEQEQTPTPPPVSARKKGGAVAFHWLFPLVLWIAGSRIRRGRFLQSSRQMTTLY